jgi:hypothetical protein
MSEDASLAAAGQPAPQMAAPQPAEQTASGQVGGQTGQAPQPTVDPAIMRNAQAYAGARPIIDRLVQGGIKTPEQLDQLLGTASKFNTLNETLAKNNLNFDTLSQLLGTGGGQDPQADYQQQAGPIGLDQVRSVVGEELRSHSLRNEHNSNAAAEQQTVKSVLAELAGGDEKVGAVAQMLFKAKIADMDRFYPEGHPLADTAYRPLSEAEIKSIAGEVRQSLQELRGTQAVQNAQQALNGARQPSGGTLQTTAPNPQNDIPLYQNREALMALATQIGQETNARLSQQYPTPMR